MIEQMALAKSAPSLWFANEQTLIETFRMHSQ